MITYVLKSSISLILLFGLYWFLLRKEKLFVFNRYFLIIAILFSLALPLISIPLNLQKASLAVILTPALDFTNMNINAAETASADGSEKDQIARENNNVIDLYTVLIALYISGIVIFLIRFLNNIRLIVKKTRSAEEAYYRDYHLILTDDKINPCCFFRNIYLNKEDYLSKRIDTEMLDHEVEHVKQSHTVDIIIVEFLKIFYWFNPVHILYDRAIRINHEYLADNEVIKGKSDIIDYAVKLLDFISGRMNTSLTSASNNSFTKNRLAMMMKSRSGRYAYGTRIAASICLGTLVFFALSFREINEPISSGNEDEIAQNVVSGVVTTNDGMPIFGASIKTTLSNDQQVETISDFNGRFSLEDIKAGASLIVEYRGFISESIISDFSAPLVIKLSRDPNFKGITTLTIVKNVGFLDPDFSPSGALVVIDGNISDLKLHPNNTRTFTILDSKDALKKYGEKGKNGVVEITSYDKSSPDRKKNSGSPADSSKFLRYFYVNGNAADDTLIEIPLSNLQNVSIWTYHYLDKTDKKEFRTIGITTRDYYTVKGTVVTENKKPLPGVRITVTGSDKAEISDKNGRFLIYDVREDAILEFSMPDFETYYLSTKFGVFRTDLTIELKKNGNDNEEIYEKVDRKPEYPGGDMALLKFIAENTTYPEAAKQEKVQGRVVVKFVVAANGKVKDATISEGVHPALDSEALRVVSKIGKFIPGTLGDQPVNVYYYLPITFGLPQ